MKISMASAFENFDDPDRIERGRDKKNIKQAIMTRINKTRRLMWLQAVQKKFLSIFFYLQNSYIEKCL